MLHRTSLSARGWLLALGMSVLFSTAAEAQFTISTTTSTGTAQTLASGTGTVNSATTLTFTGTTQAVTITGSSTFTNSGTINTTSTGRGLRDNTGGLTVTVTNNAGALIQTADADVIQMNKANSNITLNNYGTFTSLNASAGGAQAIDFNAISSGTNILNNFSTGILQAA